MPTLLAPPPLERVLQQLHDSEINAGVQTFFDAGMRVWIGDELNGIKAETTINRTAAARLKWPDGPTAAGWLHETALRLYPDSKYAKEHSTVALCRADGRDLGADMVSDGHAWAFVRYSRDYVEEEREAAAVRAGIHGHTCEPAWQWRSERRKN